MYRAYNIIIIIIIMSWHDYYFFAQNKQNFMSYFFDTNPPHGQDQSRHIIIIINLTNLEAHPPTHPPKDFVCLPL